MSPDALARLNSIADLRRIAQRSLPRPVFEFIDGGAEDELTLARNTADFRRLRFLPRVLNNVSRPATACDLFGTPSKAPIVIAPMGSCMLAWPEADIAIARAAAAHGIPYTLSTTSIERMAKAVEGALWFQLYVLKDYAFNYALIQRAKDCGYGTLVVTVDLPAGGKRERDLKNGISIPLRLTAAQVWEGVTHPGWAWRMLRAGMPEFENVRGLLSDESAGPTIAARAGQNLDAAFDWEAMARFRERWPGKLLVKGVQHPGDAARLADMGVDGIWVSNHGGRQLDGALSAIASLPGVVEAMAGRVPVMLDSGVRRGADVLKAVALGACAVAVGRAAMYGVAVAGEAGVRRALDILVGELTLSMKLAGVPSLAAADAGLIVNES
jgi:L-lactate dehydrogenase (cytochrome)/(S)-mandelate dehydrogenase